MTFLARLVLNAVAIWLTVLILPGLALVPEDRGAGTTIAVTLAVALVFGLVNAVVRPLVAFLSIPLYVLTLGLFTLVVNALMLALTAWITSLTDYGLRIDSFWWALLGALVVSVISFFLSYALLSAYERRQRSGQQRG